MEIYWFLCLIFRDGLKHFEMYSSTKYIFEKYLNSKYSKNTYMHFKYMVIYIIIIKKMSLSLEIEFFIFIEFNTVQIIVISNSIWS